MLRRFVARALACLALAAFATGRQTAARAELDGERAPLNAWYVRGGSASHGAWSHAAALSTEPAVGWSIDVGNPIEGEPLVWDDLVVVAVRRDPHSARLEVLDRIHGSTIGHSEWFATDHPLEPSLWMNRVAVRSASNAIQLLALDDPKLQRQAEFKFSGDVGAPLLFRSELYVIGADGARRIDVDTQATVWELQGLFVGEAALLGDSIYAVAYANAKGTAHRIDRTNGKSLATQLAGFHDGKVPPICGGLTLEMIDTRSFVHHLIPVPLAGGRAVTTIMAEWSGAKDSYIASRVRSHAAQWQYGWLALTVDQDDHPTWELQSYSETHRGGDLADNEVRPELTQLRVDPTVVEGAAYVGGFAFGLIDKKPSWTTTHVAAIRTVAVRDQLFVVEASSHLTELRPVRCAVSAAWCAKPTDPSSNSIAVPKARAVLVDRSVVSGNLTIKSSEHVLGTGVKAAHADIPLGDVKLVEDANHHLVYFGDPDDVPGAVQTLIEVDELRRWTDLARDAIAAHDASTATRAISRAKSLAPRDPGLPKLEKSLLSISKSTQAVPKSKQEALVSAEREAEDFQVTELCRRMAALGDEAPGSARASLAMRAWELEPDTKRVEDAIRAVVPSSFATVAASPRQLIDLARFAAGRPIEMIRGGDAERRGGQDKAIAALDATFKAGFTDLVLMRSERIDVVVSSDRISTAAFVVAIGELTCRALESLFPEAPAAGAATERLRIVLQPSNSKDAAVRTPSDDSSLRDQSLGHYDPVANATSLFLDDGATSHSEFIAPIAHVLAHQWLRNRNPRYSYATTRLMRKNQRGYWISEGLATWISELRFDLDRATFEPALRPGSIEQLVALKPDQRVAWQFVFASGRNEAEALRSPRTSDAAKLNDYGDAYLAQAASAVRYLLSEEEGKYRAALLDYVQAYFTAAPDARLGFESSFGVEPTTFGDKVLALAASSH